MATPQISSRQSVDFKKPLLITRSKSECAVQSCDSSDVGAAPLETPTPPGTGFVDPGPAVTVQACEAASPPDPPPSYTTTAILSGAKGASLVRPVSANSIAFFRLPLRPPHFNTAGLTAADCADVPARLTQGLSAGFALASAGVPGPMALAAAAANAAPAVAAGACSFLSVFPPPNAPRVPSSAC